MKNITILLIIAELVLTACNKNDRCEKYFIANRFVGTINIYYDQKKGQGYSDESGCVIYKIPKSGICLSVLPFNDHGLLDDHFAFFEVID